MYILNIILNIVHEKVAMNIFNSKVRFKFIEDILVGFGFDQFEILFDAPDKGFNLTDFGYCLLAPLEASGVWIFIVNGSVFEMNTLQSAQPIHYIPTDFLWHHTLAVRHLLRVEIRHF